MAGLRRFFINVEMPRGASPDRRGRDRSETSPAGTPSARSTFVASLLGRRYPDGHRPRRPANVSVHRLNVCGRRLITHRRRLALHRRCLPVRGDRPTSPDGAPMSADNGPLSAETHQLPGMTPRSLQTARYRWRRLADFSRRRLNVRGRPTAVRGNTPTARDDASISPDGATPPAETGRLLRTAPRRPPISSRRHRTSPAIAG